MDNFHVPSMRRMGSSVAHDALSYTLGAIATGLVIKAGAMAYEGAAYAVRRLRQPYSDPDLLKAYVQKELERMVATGEFVRPVSRGDSVSPPPTH